MIGLNNIMRATGYPKKAMLSSMLTVGCNIILAPIFIFVLNWGIPGSGTCDHLLTIHRHAVGIVSLLQSEDLYPLPASQHATETAHHSQYFCHRHVTLRHECMCLLHRNFHQQPSAQLWSDMAIGAFGILNRIQMLFVMIVMGITMGMQPITGYNYGAQHFDRVKKNLEAGNHGRMYHYYLRIYNR